MKKLRRPSKEENYKKKKLYIALIFFLNYKNSRRCWFSTVSKVTIGPGPVCNLTYSISKLDMEINPWNDTSPRYFFSNLLFFSYILRCTENIHQGPDRFMSTLLYINMLKMEVSGLWEYRRPDRCLSCNILFFFFAKL